MESKDCCGKTGGQGKEREADGFKKFKGFKEGIIYGILPHSVCIAFIVFTALGVTIAAGLVKKLLLLPYFFEALIGLSIISAVFSATIFLKRNSLLSFAGAKSKWRYLTILFGTTIGVNLLMFYVILPRTANINLGSNLLARGGQENLSSVTLSVNIPCSGHAALITEELKKIAGIGSVNFKSPNLFEINYKSSAVSPGEILSLEIFKSFKATIQE